MSWFVIVNIAAEAATEMFACPRELSNDIYNDTILN